MNRKRLIGGRFLQPCGSERIPEVSLVHTLSPRCSTLSLPALSSMAPLWHVHRSYQVLTHSIITDKPWSPITDIFITATTTITTPIHTHYLSLPVSISHQTHRNPNITALRLHKQQQELFEAQEALAFAQSAVAVAEEELTVQKVSLVKMTEEKARSLEALAQHQVSGEKT